MKIPLQYGSLDCELILKILQKCYILQFQKYWPIKHMEKEKNDDCDNETIAKKGDMTWSVVNFLPNYQNGEDKTTIDAHRSRINTQSQLTDGRHKNVLIKNCMDLTFPHRSKLLIKDLVKINYVLECYPILRSQEQVTLASKFWFLSFKFL